MGVALPAPRCPMIADGRELMSKKPIDIAREFGGQLPSFSNLAEATDYFERYRQAGLQALPELIAENPGFTMSYSPDSLTTLADVDSNLVETCRFPHTGWSQ